MIGVVTGAARGIGLEVCRQLAERGWIVVLTARTLSRARLAADTIAGPGLTIEPRALDVTNDASAAELARTLESEFGHVDCLVNNAAVAPDWSESPSTALISAVRGVLETNLFGAWRVTQALLSLLRASHHGRIVMVSSGGLEKSAAATSYSVSKAALNALTRKFAIELESTRILVNAVCPGLTATAPGMEAIGARPIADGAASVVWAATLPDDGPTGGLFRDGEPLVW